MSTSTRSMAFPKFRRRYLHPSSSSPSLQLYPFPSPPPTEPPVSPTSQYSSTSNSSSASSSFNSSYFNPPPPSHPQQHYQSSQQQYLHTPTTTATVLPVNPSSHFFLDPVCTMEEIKLNNNSTSNSTSANISNNKGNSNSSANSNNINCNGSLTLRRDPVEILSPYPSSSSSSRDTSFMKIRSSMSLSAVLNAPSTDVRTPPDSVSQTSENFAASSSSSLGDLQPVEVGDEDGGEDGEDGNEEEEEEDGEDEEDEEEDEVQVEQEPASPPQTPPEERYMSPYELNQQKLKETLEKEAARLEAQIALKKQKKEWKLRQKELSRQRKLQAAVAATNGINTEISTNVSVKSSPTRRRSSLRIAEAESPEHKKTLDSIRAEAKGSEEPVRIQPRIIRLKFRTPPSHEELHTNRLPVKRGRGRPRKFDPVTGEPYVKTKKAHQVNADGNPVVKKRKSGNGVPIKVEREILFPSVEIGPPPAAIHITPPNITIIPPVAPVVTAAVAEHSAPPPPPPPKKRKPAEEPTFHPHIHRKQKIVTTSEERVPRPSKHEHSLGLSNLGATCYINVVVQMLAHTKSLQDYFLACDFARKPANSKQQQKEAPKPKSQCVRRTRASEKTAEVLFPMLKGKLGEEFGVLIRELLFDEDLGSKKNGVASDQFWTALRANLETENGSTMDPNLVQDAHEFLLLILQALAKEASPVVDGYTLPEIIDNTFGGVHSTVFECNNCHETTRHEDKCMELEVPICRVMPALGRLEDSTLTQHLENYTLPEQQEWAPDSYITPEGEKFKACPKCGVDSGRSMRHNIRPKGGNVVIELKRFLWENGENRKVRGHVGFPMRDLDLNSCAGEGGEVGLYDLYGVVVHKGERSTTGHYISYAREEAGWLRFDDLKVQTVSEEEVARQEAYILMYEKKAAVAVA
ncbi:Ubiquitin carboxyl-terminal hydrolase 2 [Orbilia blumenaviensis]|uniref:Ubiquitin carboxyl-terminal hydrolase n=1 Tax=Orbilia blumenaviensis TaxID=1796055 RepID=A0AAV9VKU2_9PEZI